jgi:hypothetical protein
MKDTKFIILLLTLIVIFGFNFAFSSNSLSLSSKDILEKTFDNLTNVKSGEYSGIIRAQLYFKDNLLSKLESNKQSKNTYQINKPTNLFIYFNFNNYFTFLNNKNKSQKLELTIDLDIFPEQLNSFLKADLIYSTSSLYFKLNNLNLPALKNSKLNKTFFLINQISKFISNKWIKIDSKDFKGDFIVLDKNFNDLEIYTKERPSLIIKKIYKENAVKVRKLADQKIDEIETYRYSLLIDEENFKKFIISYNVENRKDFTKEKVDSLKKYLDELFLSFDISNFEIWINKKDLLPNRIFAVLNFNENLNKILKSNLGFKNGRVEISLKFKNFNKPVVINQPKSSKFLDEIITNLLIENLKLPSRR